MTLRRLCSLATFSIATIASTAHADDLQLWTAAGASLFPVERLEIRAEPQLRFDENVSRVSGVLFGMGLRYRIVKWFRVGAGYRLEYERDGGGDFELRHRLHADLGARVDLDPIRVSYRLRMQEQIRPSSRDEHRAIVRNLVGVSYRGWKRWTPGLSAELFHALGDFDNVELDRLRLTAGITYGFARRHDVELFYCLELPQQDPTEPIRHILGLTYHYDIHLD